MVVLGGLSFQLLLGRGVVRIRDETTKAIRAFPVSLPGVFHPLGLNLLNHTGSPQLPRSSGLILRWDCLASHFASPESPGGAVVQALSERGVM